MPATPSAVQIIDGRYEVMGSLGSGNFGEVYKVFDLHLKHECALKLLKSTPFGTWVEAEILRRLQGEYLLPILNADLAQGRAYVVTDLAAHGTVADQIPPDVGVPITTAVRWARQACAGVTRIHDHDLLHCDIKPENLFLNDRQDVLVGDLGLSQLQDSSGLAVAAGTPSTMAPEVARVFAPGQTITTSRTYSVRGDVYSLGATLFWMVAGAPPVPGATSCADVWAAPQPDMWDVAPHVNQGLRDVVNKALARDPGDRYVSVSAFDAALGGRALPKREWIRTVPHAGHEQCFTGTKGTSCLEVCVIPTATGTQLDITVQHAGSGRKVQRAQRTVSTYSHSAGLRSVFRACG